MTEPVCDRGNRRSALKAFGREVMPQIVMRHFRNSYLLTRSSKRLFAAHVHQNMPGPLRSQLHEALLVPDPLQQIGHRWRYRNVSTVTRFTWLDPNVIAHLVDILPFHLDSFAPPWRTSADRSATPVVQGRLVLAVRPLRYRLQHPASRAVSRDVPPAAPQVSFVRWT
jgi:hypothetical protein